LSVCISCSFPSLPLKSWPSYCNFSFLHPIHFLRSHCSIIATLLLHHRLTRLPQCFAIHRCFSVDLASTTVGLSTGPLLLSTFSLGGTLASSSLFFILYQQHLSFVMRSTCL
jgi:hypothetical protein